MKGQAMTALRMTLVTLILTGIAYPLAVTGLARILFPWQSQGSLVLRGGRLLGSELIEEKSYSKYE